MCACIMHNLVLTTMPFRRGEVDTEDVETHDVIPGAWREEIPMTGLVPLSGHRLPRDAKLMREYLSHYFQSPVGAVEWQERMIRPELRA